MRSTTTTLRSRLARRTAVVAVLTVAGGPLTEVTACDQAGSCGSITNVDDWGRLWSSLSSNAKTKQYDMPHGTDGRID